MEPIPPLKGSQVLIVGKGPGWEKAKEFLDAGWNVWTIPQSFSLLCDHRVDLVFEIHSPDQWRRKRGTIQELNGRYTIPKLIVPERVPNMTNNSYLLPVAELQAMELPLVNSFCWMMAYALYRGATSIALRGVNLDWAHEAGIERDGVMFLLGYIRALGIELNLDAASGLASQQFNF